jgi:tetrahydromethanopterin S-methyltransferase subunit F
VAVSGEQLARADAAQDPGPDEDWAAGAADAIERAVQSVRAKTADPLERVVRLVVYGLLAGIVGIAIGVLLAIAAFRGLVELLDLVWQPEVWLAYLILGGIFVSAGLLVWTRRTAKSEKS